MDASARWMCRVDGWGPGRLTPVAPETGGGREMAVGEEMRGFREDLVASCEARTRGLADLREETSGLLSGFDSAHKDRERARRGAARRIRAALSRERSNLRHGAAQFTRTLQRDLKAMRRGLRLSLQGGANDRKRCVSAMIGRFHQFQGEMGGKLKRFLVQDRSERRADVERMVNEIRGRLKGFRDDLRGVKEEWRRARSETSAIRSGKTPLRKSETARPQSPSPESQAGAAPGSKKEG